MKRLLSFLAAFTLVCLGGCTSIGDIFNPLRTAADSVRQGLKDVGNGLAKIGGIDPVGVRALLDSNAVLRTQLETAVQKLSIYSNGSGNTQIQNRDLSLSFEDVLGTFYVVVTVDSSLAGRWQVSGPPVPIGANTSANIDSAGDLIRKDLAAEVLSPVCSGITGSAQFTFGMRGQCWPPLRSHLVDLARADSLSAEQAFQRFLSQVHDVHLPASGPALEQLGLTPGRHLLIVRVEPKEAGPGGLRRLTIRSTTTGAADGNPRTLVPLMYSDDPSTVSGSSEKLLKQGRAVIDTIPLPIEGQEGVRPEEDRGPDNANAPASKKARPARSR